MKNIIKLIENEIKWCEENEHPDGEEAKKHFIKGLKQAIVLIRSIEPKEK